MKRIIRLTESDLARIVKRVLNESTPTTLKLKLYGPDSNFVTNLDCTNMKLRGKLIDFDFKVAGGGLDYVYGATKGGNYPAKDIGKEISGGVMIEEGNGILECGSYKMRAFNILIEKNSKFPNGKFASYGARLSKKGYDLVQKTFCDAYASTDTKQDDLDMGGNFV